MMPGSEKAVTKKEERIKRRKRQWGIITIQPRCTCLSMFGMLQADRRWGVSRCGRLVMIQVGKEGGKGEAKVGR